MAKGKRNRAHRRNNVGRLEHDLSQLSNLRQRYAKRVKEFDVKIAAQEAIIEEAKQEAAA
jgi:hypothetical protein